MCGSPHLLIFIYMKGLLEFRLVLHMVERFFEVTNPISDMSLSSQGEFAFTVTVEAGARFKIEESSDFVIWTLLLNNENAQGAFRFADRRPPGAARFYRVVFQP